MASIRFCSHLNPIHLAVQYAYLSPSNLSNAFPFFAGVSDVRSFDAAAFEYFSDPYQFRTTKFTNQLGCTNASAATIRYQRTVLCSMWVNQQWSAQCLSRYNGTSAATSPKMVCQSTCRDYAASEQALVNSTMYCPGGDRTNGTREAQLTKDFTDCTDWTTLTTNSTETCVSGESNEPNCGFGSSTEQLCRHCSGSQPDDCCYNGELFPYFHRSSLTLGSIDMSVCGFFLPLRPTGSATSPRPSATSAGSLQNESGPSSSNNGGAGLSGGQIAGIVVGSVLGGFFMVGKLVLLFWWCRRRQKRKDAKLSQQPNNSEKGLIGTGGSQNGTNGSGSSPTMGGDTLYAGSAHAKSAESGLIGGGLAGVGAGTALGRALGGDEGASGGMPERAGVVLPRVRDENQNGEKYIETGAEVRVLWPLVSS